MQMQYERVRPTEAEMAEYQTKNRRRPGVSRVQCRVCGQRLWGSGLGIGAHNRKNCTAL
jgi:hypothetical protein